MKRKQLFIQALMLCFLLSGINAQSEVRSINLNFNDVKGPMSIMFKECIGAGRANEGLRADWQQQLAFVKDQCDFKYIRMHGLLTDDMGLYQEDRDGNPQYNFQYIDVLYDYILEIGMKPFVELGFMPSALASGPETIFWWRGNVTPPKDHHQWEALIYNLVSHWTERYGIEEVKTWYFEVWNEPNLSPGFWSGSQEDYFKLYQFTATGVKKVNKDYKVGGPATAGAACEVELIDFCRNNNVALDFISTHAYGVDQGFLDEWGNSGTRLAPDPMSLSQDVLNSRKEIAGSVMPDLELHYTEWSSSYTPADPIHDSYHQAAYILDRIKKSGDAATSMSYWVFTDIFEEAGPRLTPFHGGFGLINYQGIPKSAFFAYKYMNQLGTTELVNGDATSWATQDDDGNIKLLLWNYTYTLPDSVNDQDYYIQDLPARPKGKVQIEIADIPKGKYLLEVYQVGYRVNDPYTDYYDMGRPNQLTRAQVKKLKTVSNGEPVLTEKITIKTGKSFLKELDLRENDVFLLMLKKQ
ncbi:MAG: glycoside hydrolase [Candidatus Marinimicrobia bacterium]|nr:glycoside hydrolase [Candidatus Neomarinimicrobiota bacterium]